MTCMCLLIYVNHHYNNSISNVLLGCPQGAFKKHVCLLLRFCLNIIFKEELSIKSEHPFNTLRIVIEMNRFYLQSMCHPA